MPLDWALTGERRILLRGIGCGLMVSGWLIVVAALALLGGLGERFGFVGAGLAVEVLGLALLARGYKQMDEEAG